MTKLRFEVYGVKHNGKLAYVGKTQYGMPKRKSKHKYEAYTKLFNDDFHKFIRKVGFDELEWFVIERCNSQEEITGKEKMYIKELKPKYNKQEKAFYCYDLEHNFVGEFSNVYDTGNILKINPKSISDCLNGSINKHKNFIFTYENININEKIFLAKHYSIVSNLGWKTIIEIYSMSNEIKNKSYLARKFNVDRVIIRNIINGLGEVI